MSDPGQASTPDGPVITPPDETSMTVEALDSFTARITVERGNAYDVQVMNLTTQEWQSLLCLLETFATGGAPAAGVTFRALRTERAVG